MADLKKGMQVWWKREEEGGKEWIRGLVVKLEEDVVTVTAEGRSAEERVDKGAVLMANPAMLDSVGDLTMLSFLHEPGILDVLQKRFQDIYTHAGPVLVAINPFTPVELYSEEYVKKYVKRPAMGEGSRGYPPHIFLTADQAFKQMKLDGVDQSILITGESGAGKTETSKIVMKYVAGLAGGSGMEDRVLQTNPILEAFGNAKTVHNNNSSRFGKLIDIHFDRSFAICGASIETYLLEKSRVVHQLPQERNYHIFYQLCHGANDDVREACMLPLVSEHECPEAHFVYLNRNQSYSIDGVDDAKNFEEIVQSMNDVGISSEQQLIMWKVLSAILWMGNIEFEATSDDSVKVLPGTALENAANLLGVTSESLEASLTTRKMVAGGEHITRELSLEASMDVRDALAKFLYEAQFRELVHMVNKALKGDVSKRASKSKLSLLDIYGFECFNENSFEQLCINYANERLQQQFAGHLFKLEQQIYEEEGVDWQYISFQDNQECVDLIEAKPPSGLGLLTLLDEECLFPKGTDTSFSEKVCKTHANHPRFSYNPNDPGRSFTVEHYAGPVKYTSGHFLDKNRDTLSPDLLSLVQGSSSLYVADLANHMGVGNERGRTSSVGSRFREQLKDLLFRVDKSHLHFVKCIKPNSMQAPGIFDAQLVLHQLRCCGILEVARIAQAGYPSRYTHEDFANRYETFLPGSNKNSMSPLDTCKSLLNHFRVDKSQYQTGKTMLFFRAGVLGQLEDHVLRATDAVLKIQSSFRMYENRKAYLETRTAAIQIQSGWRARAAKELFMELKAKSNAACQLQASYRAYVARRRFQEIVNATIYLQRWWRRVRLQRKIDSCVAEWEAETQREQEIAEAKEMERKVEKEKIQNDFNVLQKDFNMDSAQIRDILQQYSAGLLVPVSTLPDSKEPDDKALQELQRINVQLQKEVDDLKDENTLLLELRKAPERQTENRHPRIVSITAAAHGSEPSSPAGSLDSVSIMSYSDTEPESAKKNAKSSKDQRQMSFGRAGPTGAVAALNAELEKKGSLFDDDAAFIKEVHEGVSCAPSMDPDFEIRRLLVRYKTWHREFKARLRSTQQSLRKAPASPEAPPLYSSSSRKDDEKKHENKLSNKLRSLSKVARLGK